MTRWRAIAMTTVLFGAVGPAIGAAVMSLQRPPGTVKDLVLLAYVFGGIPALIGFLRRLLLAGIPAGMLCALLTRSASASGES